MMDADKSTADHLQAGGLVMPSITAQFKSKGTRTRDVDGVNLGAQGQRAWSSDVQG
jgi:hypothetical protein